MLALGTNVDAPALMLYAWDACHSKPLETIGSDPSGFDISTSGGPSKASPSAFEGEGCLQAQDQGLVPHEQLCPYRDHEAIQFGHCESD